MYLTSLDIGSSKIKALVAEVSDDNKLSLVDVFKFPSLGVRRGEVVDYQATSNSLAQVFSELKRIHKNVLKNIFVNISGKNIKIQNSRGIVAVSRADSEIYQDDIERALKASQAVNLPPNRKIIHTVLQKYIIDGNEQTQSPLGMNGTRLEIDSLVVDAFTPVINDLIKSIQIAGGEIDESRLIYSPLASSQSALNKTHKELGVVLIDIGFGTTSMAVFEEDELIDVKVFPIGASNITNDLAIALKSSIETSEKIKLSLGHAWARDVSLKEKIDLSEVDKNLKGIISRRYIAEIVESRLAEIFELVHNELKSMAKTQLPAGAILCGGGAKIEGIIDLAKHELKLPVHLANCELDIFDSASKEYVSKLEDLEFMVASGLLFYGAQEMGIGESGKGWLSNKKGLISKVFRNLLP